MYHVAIDPGANSAVALIIGDQAWGYQCNDEQQLDKALQVLKDIAAGRYGSQGVIALENVHSMPLWGHQRNFQFGENTGFWVGILRFLKLPYVKVAPMVWQTAVTKKPARPDVTGMTKKEVDKLKREHGDALKQESIRAAKKAFPRGIFSSHDVADAVNIARYLKLKYPDGIAEMTECEGTCMKKATKKMKIMKGKKASKAKVVNAAKKAGVSSKGAVKTKGKNLAGGVY